MPASEIIRMIGVNTHMGYADTAYAKVDSVIQDLKFLGVSYIRDRLPAGRTRDVIRRMSDEHVKLNIFFGSGWNASSLVWLRWLETAVPGAIASLEGYNEINNFPVTYGGESGPAAAKKGQQALYAAVKSDPDLKHIPVVDMTGFEMIRDPRFSYATTLSGFADVMNVHAYSQNGAQPRYWINPARPAWYKRLGADLPKVITEFGYSSRPESGWGFIGVDESSQAKGILNGIFDAARSGYEKLYIYELLDERPDPEMKDLQSHFGLFTYNNDPKQAAKAIRNLMLLVSSGGDQKNWPANLSPSDASASNTGISVSAEGADLEHGLYSLVLTKGDRARLVAVWREPEFWDRESGRAVEAGSIKANVSFGTSCASIRSYDVLVSEAPIATSSGESFSLSLGDHVQILECIS